MSDEPRLTSPKEVRALLERLGHRPNKGLGQNFLIDANVLDILVGAANLRPGEAVLEIGPGLGALTERLAARGGAVTCIEKDPAMAAYLRTRLDGLALIEQDALAVDLDALFAGGIGKVAANLPYSVASRLMVEIAECPHRPALAVLTIQKEVADRLVAPPGGKHYGVLGILVGAFYEGALVKTVSPGCFLPPPKVWSAIVRLRRRDDPLVGQDEYPAFKKLVKACFSQRRKQIGTILRRLGMDAAGERLAAAGIGADARPESIAIGRWVALSRRMP